MRPGLCALLVFDVSGQCAARRPGFVRCRVAWLEPDGDRAAGLVFVTPSTCLAVAIGDAPVRCEAA